ncbi:CP2 transcription factor-domain-containing protein [Syncephalastrum racemosum]|uniref:CP2 transcription factor-domain-containing protein n=1 Tax=Syncephalastrum racemosum TaxID=13706 RepID=A0A1X2HW23_SYNRA|nr:CP2 transcription factor-domain-containing protein [Syncephalastrum racemosum]
MTSTFVIMFHEPSHRKVALNYWKFWLGQQKSPLDARAVTLDEDQSFGIENIRFPSFDRITFDWNGRQGAKVFVRFNCLSTDFSRIKGVKGIPLRAHMETRVTVNLAASASLQPYAGTFQAADGETIDALRRAYVEQVYCKIKLFRDKGAERKNKDDAKQIGKHMERVYAEANPHQHPFWLMYNQPKPYSTICEVPVMASEMDCRKPLPIEQPQPPPATLPANTTLSNSSSSNSSSHQSSNGEPPVVSSFLPSATAAPAYSHQQQQQQQQYSSSPKSPQFLTSSVLLHGVKSDPNLSTKRSYSDIFMEEQHNQHLQQQQQPQSFGLSLLINIKTTQHQRFQSPPSPTENNDHPLTANSNSKRPLQRINLEHISIPCLISKLCPLLSLHYSQVSEVLWRQPRNMSCSAIPFRTTNLRSNSPDHGVAIILDDSVLSEYFINGMVVGVEWEIKSDGTVRLLLQ